MGFGAKGLIAAVRDYGGVCRLFRFVRASIRGFVISCRRGKSAFLSTEAYF